MRKRYNKYYVVVIADYNDDDAHGIVHDNLYYWFDQHDLTILEFDRVDARPFNTVQTGYLLARRALNPLSPSARQVFLVNTAPRLDDPRERTTNQGEALVQVELKSGKLVYAVGSGYTLSFIKPEIHSMRALNVPPDASAIPLLVEALRRGRPGQPEGAVGAGQFRSAYVYPVVVARALAGTDEPIAPAFASLTGECIDPSAIPDIPADAIVFRDGYGNLKTSIRPEALAPHFGRLAVVSCRGREIVAHVKPGIFDVPLGHFSLAPGSTLLAFSDGGVRQFVEVVLRGGHAARAFAAPAGVPGAGPAREPVEGESVAWRLAGDEDLARLGYRPDGTPPARVLEAAASS